MLLWPYDELSLSHGQTPSEFLIQTPWLSVTLNVAEPDQERIAALVTKVQSQKLGPADAIELSWFLRPLAGLPLAYMLPRTSKAFVGKDIHRKLDSTALMREWSWDLETTLQFAQVSQEARGEKLYDPYSLLTVARRYHLLDLLQRNPLKEAFARIEALASDPERHRQANAFLVRQNHYVTCRCEEALEPALKISQSAESAVRAFMEAERGHDRILEKALRSFVPDPLSVPVVPAAVELMNILKESASSNLLGFALAVDIFERASYGEKDPLASFLANGGFERAAKQIDVHKKINDSGGHENASLGFLEHMAPVDREYATEAVHLAEAASQAVMSVSDQILAAVIAGI